MKIPLPFHIAIEGYFTVFLSRNIHMDVLSNIKKRGWKKTNEPIHVSKKQFQLPVPFTIFASGTPYY